MSAGSDEVEDEVEVAEDALDYMFTICNALNAAAGLSRESYKQLLDTIAELVAKHYRELWDEAL